jgi:3-hydroxyacyl-CoA dehydrogenase/3a,7a,12a-trihydroxy-5b-cholest-24-enoyl-CoA hydratase
LELFKPLPTSGKLVSKGVISDVLDKGSGAVIIADITSYDENGEKIAFNQTTTFVQKAGGFGGKRSSDKAIEPIPPPSRAPDTSVKEKTAHDQAALYRLSGDRNPLHIDPSFAAMGGFSTPILHGLCSFGYAVRHVLQTYAGNDVSKFKSVKVRFSKPVLPGQTIQTDMWKEGSRIFFQCKVVETGAVSLSGAYVDLHAATPGVVAQPTAATNTPLCETDVLMKIVSARIGTQPELTKQINAIFQLNILKDKKQVSQWTVDMKVSPAKAYAGPCQGGKPGVTVTMEDSDLMDVATGKLAGPKAFLSGKMKLKGNIMLAQKLGTIFMEFEKAKL